MFCEAVKPDVSSFFRFQEISVIWSQVEKCEWMDQIII